MANIAVINAVGISPHAFAPIAGGADAFSRVLEYARHLPEIDRVCLFTDSERAANTLKSTAPPDLKSTVRTGEWNVARLFEELEEQTKDHIDLFYFYADCPLLDLEITERMYASHRKYFSEYTFADGYPRGLTPEIILGERIPAMRRLVSADDTTIERATLFTVISHDINSFDIETEISPKDLRLLRVDLYCDGARNFQVVDRVVKAGGGDGAAVLEIVENRQEMLRSLPAFFEIQITEAVSQLVSYSPYPKVAGEVLRKGKEMPVARFRSLIERISQFAEDAVVSLSLWGEPALHADIAELVEETLKHQHLGILIETSGVGWKPGVLEKIRELEWERITWIVDLDASTKELYETLRGPGWEEAQAACNRLLELFPDRVHVQATRMQENEADLESFYNYWKGRVPNVIIQKYDWFCGFLPQRKVTDLSPIKRLPCWHLKRDMVILVDGSVPMCREDLRGRNLLGNVFENSLEEIWAQGESPYKEHLRQEYPDLCKACDEYYTYNF